MKKTKIHSMVFISAILLLAYTTWLTGCGSGANGGNSGNGVSGSRDNQIVKDDRATDLQKAMLLNRSPIFKTITDVKDIQSPVLIIIKDGQSVYFHESSDPSFASSPEQTASCLLVTTKANDDGTINCALNLGMPDGSLSFDLDEMNIESLSELENYLLETFNINSGAENLPETIYQYQKQFFSQEYLHAINNMRNTDYSGNIKVSDINDPMVFITDDEYVVKAVGGDYDFAPAERNQYAPATTSVSDYARPSIEGGLGLGFTSVGRYDAESGTISYKYTVDEVKAYMSQERDTFCFLEIVGLDPYGEFSSESSGQTVLAHTYIMRISTINKDGVFLGSANLYFTQSKDYRTNSGSQLSKNFMNQLAAITMSYDRYDRAVFQWGYIGEIWRNAEP